MRKTSSPCLGRDMWTAHTGLATRPSTPPIASAARQLVGGTLATHKIYIFCKFNNNNNNNVADHTQIHQ
ncbi:unnamed protein product [Nezara viridula]|uniref:Uncharacterized protein n=1 Tax=Nezara viridula TaxID=85310 RepID=A0A9P0H0N8_NEZVI|nr:unnamed protein product [Nezara viridula]